MNEVELWQLRNIVTGENLTDPQPLPENYSSIFGLSGFKEKLNDLSWIGESDKGWFFVGYKDPEPVVVNVVSDPVIEEPPKQIIQYIVQDPDPRIDQIIETQQKLIEQIQSLEKKENPTTNLDYEHKLQVNEDAISDLFKKIEYLQEIVNNNNVDLNNSLNSLYQNLNINLDQIKNEFVVIKELYTKLKSSNEELQSFQEADISLLDDENYKKVIDKLIVQKLKDSDWAVLNDVKITRELRVKYEIYRDELRMIKQQSGYPRNIIWPDKP